MGEMLGGLGLFHFWGLLVWVVLCVLVCIVGLVLMWVGDLVGDIYQLPRSHSRVKLYQ